MPEVGGEEAEVCVWHSSFHIPSSSEMASGRRLPVDLCGTVHTDRWRRGTGTRGGRSDVSSDSHYLIWDAFAAIVE